MTTIPTRTAVVLGLCAWTLSANAVPLCPADPFAAGDLEQTTRALRELAPVALDNLPGNNCKPKVTTVIAYGRPLCLFHETHLAIGAAVNFVEGRSEAISAQFSFLYSADRHAKLRTELDGRYSLVAPNDYPLRLKSIPIQRQLTAVYRRGDLFVVLDKPSVGMPGEGFSSVSFEKSNYLDVIRRDLNTCR